jgi:chromosome segregation ATPase
VLRAITRRWLTLLSLMFVGLALVLAGCGSSNKESSEEAAAAAWANDFCGALTTWKESVGSIRATLQDTEQLSKAKLEQAASDLSDANAKLADEMRSLETPPKVAGPEAKSAVQELRNKLQASASQIRSAATGVSSAQEAVQAVGVASGAVQTMSSDISSTLTTLESLDGAETWQKAFTDSESCQSVSKS